MVGNQQLVVAVEDNQQLVVVVGGNQQLEIVVVDNQQFAVEDMHLLDFVGFVVVPNFVVVADYLQNNF